MAISGLPRYALVNYHTQQTITLEIYGEGGLSTTPRNPVAFHPRLKAVISCNIGIQPLPLESNGTKSFATQGWASSLPPGVQQQPGVPVASAAAGDDWWAGEEGSGGCAVGPASEAPPPVPEESEDAAAGSWWNTDAKDERI